MARSRPQVRSLDPCDVALDTRWLLRFARRLVRKREVAEDVVQDTWVAALQHAPRGLDREHMRAWLARVARSLASHEHRRGDLRRHHERLAVEDAEAEPQPVERLELDRRQRESIELVNELREPYRTAVLLRYRDSLPYAEIGAQMTVSEPLARQYVSRGLAKVRAKVKGRSAPFGSWGAAVAAWYERTRPAWNRVAHGFGASAALALLLALYGAESAASDGLRALAPERATADDRPSPPSGDDSVERRLAPFLGAWVDVTGAEGTEALTYAATPSGDVDITVLRKTKAGPYEVVAEGRLTEHPSERDWIQFEGRTTTAGFESVAIGEGAVNAGVFTFEFDVLERDGTKRRFHERVRAVGPDRLVIEMEMQSDDGTWALDTGEYRRERPELLRTRTLR